MRTHWSLLPVACIVLLHAASSALAADVTITKSADNGRHVKAAGYEADVAPDGAMTSLNVKGQEMLKPGVGVSRGAYCYQHAAVALKIIAQPDEATVVASAEGKPSVTYTFGADSITLAVANRTAADLQYVIVLDPAVNVVTRAGGPLVKTPTKQAWPDSTWFAGAHKLQVTGATKLWGPYLGDTNVIESDVAAGQARTLVLHVGEDTAVAASIAAVGQGKIVEPDLTLDSPRPWQVFQRRTRAVGMVRVSGRVKPAADAVEVKLTGASMDGALPDAWQHVPLDAATHAFNAELPTPAGGWYRLTVQAKVGEKVVAQAELMPVGVGEVFVIAGQSNSTNYGERRTEPQSGMAATFDGASWRAAADPQPGTHDNSTGGSPWPAFADAMAARFHVPIGIASTGHGGTSVNAWQPGGELFKHTLARVDQLGYGGFRALLWHQGETDVEMSTDEYFAKLANTIAGSKRAAGWEFPWFVAQVSYHHPTAKSYNITRDAQKRLWEQGIALEGPDTDTLVGDMRDGNGAGIHLSGKGLQAHGNLWAEKVGPWLEKTIASEQAKP